MFHGMAHPDSFGARADLEVGDQSYEIFRLDALQSKYDVARLPYSIKILLENLLRFEDGSAVTAEDVEKVAKWDHKADPSQEIAYTPARVLMQDFTGVPAVVDLAAMRDAIDDMGGDAPSAVPCEGEILIHAVRRRKVLRTVDFGPIEPGARQRLSARLPSGRTAKNCFIAVIVTRRHDNARSVTRSRTMLGCLRR